MQLFPPFQAPATLQTAGIGERNRPLDSFVSERDRPLDFSTSALARWLETASFGPCQSHSTLSSLSHPSTDLAAMSFYSVGEECFVTADLHRDGAHPHIHSSEGDGQRRRATVSRGVKTDDNLSDDVHPDARAQQDRVNAELCNARVLILEYQVMRAQDMQEQERLRGQVHQLQQRLRKYEMDEGEEQKRIKARIAALERFVETETVLRRELEKTASGNNTASTTVVHVHH